MSESGVIQPDQAPPVIVDAYRRHRDGLVRFATVLVGADDAQDVVSSAMVRVLEKAPNVHDPRAYLYRAVANQARNLHRSESRRRAREEKVSRTRNSAEAPEPYPEVRNAIERLSVRQRAVVYLTYWEDMTDAAVADHLGIGAGSVRRHLARARAHLRKALHDHE